MVDICRNVSNIHPPLTFVCCELRSAANNIFVRSPSHHLTISGICITPGEWGLVKKPTQNAPCWYHRRGHATIIKYDSTLEYCNLFLSHAIRSPPPYPCKVCVHPLPAFGRDRNIGKKSGQYTAVHTHPWYIHSVSLIVDTTVTKLIYTTVPDCVLRLAVHTKHPNAQL